MTHPPFFPLLQSQRGRVNLLVLNPSNPPQNLTPSSIPDGIQRVAIESISGHPGSNYVSSLCFSHSLDFSPASLAMKETGSDRQRRVSKGNAQPYLVINDDINAYTPVWYTNCLLFFWEVRECRVRGVKRRRKGWRGAKRRCYMDNSSFATSCRFFVTNTLSSTTRFARRVRRSWSSEASSPACRSCRLPWVPSASVK